MYCELPVLQTCCFCLPLRPGLIAWTCIEILAVLILGSVVLKSSLQTPILINSGYIHLHSLIKATLDLLILINIVVDIVFSIVFLVSAYKKNQRLMKKYLNCLITMFVVSHIVYIFLASYIVTEEYVSGILFKEITIICIIVGILSAVLQFYIYLLVKGEIQKLQNCWSYTLNPNIPPCYIIKDKVNAEDIEAAQPQFNQEPVTQEVLSAKYDRKPDTEEVLAVKADREPVTEEVLAAKADPKAAIEEVPPAKHGIKSVTEEVLVATDDHKSVTEVIAVKYDREPVTEEVFVPKDDQKVVTKKVIVAKDDHTAVTEFIKDKYHREPVTAKVIAPKDNQKAATEEVLQSKTTKN